MTCSSQVKGGLSQNTQAKRDSYTQEPTVALQARGVTGIKQRDDHFQRDIHARRGIVIAQKYRVVELSVKKRR